MSAVFSTCTPDCAAYDSACTVRTAAWAVPAVVATPATTATRTAAASRAVVLSGRTGDMVRDIRITILRVGAPPPPGLGDGRRDWPSCWSRQYAFEEALSSMLPAMKIFNPARC